LIAALVLASSFGAFAGDEEKVFRGEISDSQCALNIHSLTQSHQEMLKSKSGAAGQTAATCAQYCIERLGGKFVLASKDHVYHLDNQELPRRYVGKQVKIRGTLDTKNGMIHVMEFDPE
jgi:hypothetical protein